MSDPQQPPLPPYASNAPQPASHPAQPAAYPAQPAPSSQQPYYAPMTQPAAATATNTPGRIGFILGLAGLGISLLMTTIVQIIIRSPGTGVNFAMVNLVSGVGALIAFAAALAALIFGIIGLRKVGLPHARAGIATGLGISGVVGGVFSFLLAITAQLFY